MTPRVHKGADELDVDAVMRVEQAFAGDRGDLVAEAGEVRGDGVAGLIEGDLDRKGDGIRGEIWATARRRGGGLKQGGSAGDCGGGADKVSSLHRHYL